MYTVIIRYMYHPKLPVIFLFLAALCCSSVSAQKKGTTPAATTTTTTGKKGKPAAKKAAPAASPSIAEVPAGMNPDSTGFGFFHTCGKKDLLDVRIVPGSDGEEGNVYVYNRLTEIKAVTTKGSRGQDSVVGSSINWHVYGYGSVFDPLAYLSELSRLYPSASEDCLKYLVSRINAELLARSVAAVDKKTADPAPVSTSADSAVATTSSKKGAKATVEKVPDATKPTVAAPANAEAKTASVAVPASAPASTDTPRAAPRHIQIIPGAPINMIPEYSTSDTTVDTVYKTIVVRLQLTGPFDSTDNVVTFRLLNSTALADQLTITNPTLVITKGAWDTTMAHGGVYVARIFVRTLSLKDSIKNVQRNYILLAGDTANANHSQEIVLRAYDPNKPFWVELGANFDLLNGLQSNNLYGAIVMYKRDVARVGKDRSNNLSLFGGVYEAKTVSSEQSLNFSNFQYLSNSAFIPPAGTPGAHYQVYQDTGTVSKITSVNNLGLFISPQLRLTNGSANSDGLHVFVSVWLEVVWQRATTTFDYSKTAFVDSFPIVPDSAQYYRYKPGTLQGDYRSQFYGVGMPIYLKEHNTNLYLNSVIGIANQVGLRAEYLNNKPNLDEFFSGVKTTASGVIPWKPFWLFQFRLNEEKFGISFTGEVRGVIARSYKPFITLALSKKFDLSKLLEFK